MEGLREEGEEVALTDLRRLAAVVIIMFLNNNNTKEEGLSFHCPRGAPISLWPLLRLTRAMAVVLRSLWEWLAVPALTSAQQPVLSPVSALWSLVMTGGPPLSFLLLPRFREVVAVGGAFRLEEEVEGEEGPRPHHPPWARMLLPRP